jgi:release factor glutamine methyltransferase
LAKLLPDIEVTATDISLAALEAARDNARLNNVTINFIPGDLFDACGPQPAVYDMILCNPPYVASAEINGLQPEISYEPKLALDGGSDGLDFYRRIIRASRDYLGQGSFLIMEMGFNQYPRIKEIFRDSGKFDTIKAVRDYNDIDRVVLARYV